MRKRVLAVLAYIGAGLTLAFAICVPFYLMGAFSTVVAHAGLRVDDKFTGGKVAQSFVRKGYTIRVYEPVWPRMLERTEPFAQMVFEPASALPAQVNEAVDLDGDGEPDVRVQFAVPRDASVKIHGDVIALNEGYESLANVSNESFSRMVVRVGDRIVVRVPLRDVARR